MEKREEILFAIAYTCVCVRAAVGPFLINTLFQKRKNNSFSLHVHKIEAGKKRKIINMGRESDLIQTRRPCLVFHVTFYHK